MDWNLYLLAFVYTPLLVVGIGLAAVYLHGRYMDREDARERAAKQPAE